MGDTKATKELSTRGANELRCRGKNLLSLNECCFSDLFIHQVKSYTEALDLRL